MNLKRFNNSATKNLRQSAIDRGRELILETRQQLADEITQKQTIQLITTILLYKFTNLNREELENMLGIDEEFKKTRMYQSIREEINVENVPPLLALGLSVEQIALALHLTVEQVQQAAQSQAGS